MLPVAEVVNLHNLVMGGIRQQQVLRKHRVWGDNHPRQYITMLDKSDFIPSDNTGAVDTYLSVKLAKPRHRYWSMLISTLEGANTETEATSNKRTLYRLDWDKSQALGIWWVRECISTRENNQLLQGVSKMDIEPALLVDGKSVSRVTPAEYIYPSDIAVLRQRISAISEAVMLSSPDERTNAA